MKDKILACLLVMMFFVGIAYPSEHYTHPHPRPEIIPPDGISIPSEHWNRLGVDFLMELEGFAAQSDGVSESDLALATIELLLDIDVVDGISGYVGFLWEEDDTEDNVLDVGYLTFGATDLIPFYLTAGKMYLPFGNFESVFISDPLTLELAEIRESAVLAGYANDWVDVNVGAFNGDFPSETDDDTINDTFASVAVTPCGNLMLGAYWLSDLLDADGFEAFSTTLGSDYEAANGAGAYLNAQIGPVAINAEVVGALERIDDGAGDELYPMAYNIEASMPVHEKFLVGIKFEGSDDFYGDVGAEKWADKQYGFVVSYAANEHVTLSGEYLHAEGLDDDNSGNQATMQVALVL
jgi:hypothetical protein